MYWFWKNDLPKNVPPNPVVKMIEAHETQMAAFLQNT